MMPATLLLALLMLQMAVCHRHYMDTIPNGHNVPDPCSSEIWEGVGHQNPLGAGLKNVFGNDFAAHAHSWAAVCRLDSDGDGRTNGQELGDPRCVWAPGHGPHVPVPEGPASGHPGICEPVGSAACAGKWAPC